MDNLSDFELDIQYEVHANLKRELFAKWWHLPEGVIDDYMEYQENEDYGGISFLNWLHKNTPEVYFEYVQP